jgi:hypothetical protein
VAGVFVNGTAWSAAFRNALYGPLAAPFRSPDAPLGYSVPAGPGQLRALPWENVNQVSIRFDMDVRVAQDDLTIIGAGGTTYAFSGFRYDAPTRTATWTLSGPLGNDRLRLALDGTAAGVVGADTGNRLDGEWADGSDAYTSGDGTAGGDFRFGLNVLPGDANGDGEVTLQDYQLARVPSARRHAAARPGEGKTAYSPFFDVNGDGLLATDPAAVLRRLGHVLPRPLPPPAPLFPPAAGEELFSLTPVLA